MHKKLSRAERAFMALRHRWLTSWEIAHKVGTVCPQKTLSELRARGVRLQARRRPDGLNEYRVARVSP